MLVNTKVNVAKPLIALGLLVSCAAVASEPLLQSSMQETAEICLQAKNASEVDSVMVAVELATTSEQRSQGLMMRETLADKSGMLFVYPYTAQRSFWMYRTLIPLDIAYISEEGEILDIQQMEPCQSYWSRRCPNYPAAAPFLYALEVNAGKFAEWGMQEGDTVLQSDCKSQLGGITQW